MAAALGWGALAAVSLVIGAALGLARSWPDRAVGLVLAFGAGALISAVSFDLAEEGVQLGGADSVALGLGAGALAYFVADRALERGDRSRAGPSAGAAPPAAAARSAGAAPPAAAGPSAGAAVPAAAGPSAGAAPPAAAGRPADSATGRDPARRGGAAAAETPSPGAGSALALGAFLDGIPEQLVLGIGLAVGDGVSVGLLAAIFVSNLPEAIGSASEMRAAGRRPSTVARLWLLVALVCTLATVAGYALADVASSDVRATINGFAAGALLVMLIDSMIPDAARQAGEPAGLVTVLGFAVAAGLSGVE